MSDSSTPAQASLTPEGFCARVVEISERNMAACAFSEQANIPSLGVVKPLSGVKQECELRVKSKNVQFHGDVAQRCVDAADRRGGKTTLYAFHRIPACNGVVTGTAAENQPANYPEECAPGLALLKNRCVKPQPKNARCPSYPGGLLGKTDEHPVCEQGLGCFLTFWSSDGFPDEYTCLEPRPVGAPCKPDANACEQGTSCYQGKCRARAALSGPCMGDGDCAPDLSCQISGGVFGTCITRPQVVESCGPAAK